MTVRESVVKKLGAGTVNLCIALAVYAVEYTPLDRVEFCATFFGVVHQKHAGGILMGIRHVKNDILDDSPVSRPVQIEAESILVCGVVTGGMHIRHHVDSETPNGGGGLEDFHGVNNGPGTDTLEGYGFFVNLHMLVEDAFRGCDDISVLCGVNGSLYRCEFRRPIQQDFPVGIGNDNFRHAENHAAGKRIDFRTDFFRENGFPSCDYIHSKAELTSGNREKYG